jgi:hypothetical protein
MKTSAGSNELRIAECGLRNQKKRGTNKKPDGTQINTDEHRFSGFKRPFYCRSKFDGLVKSLLDCHPGERRGPEHFEITGFRLSPE